MKILNINIREFGGLSGFSASFDGGINLICGDNESGKSTILGFIRFMLYGMPQKRGEDNSAERERSLSWTGGTADGSMDVEWQGGAYRIERRGCLRDGRDAYTERCTTVDLTTGSEVHRGEVPGRVFLGVPAAVFDSTCSVRQLAVGDVNGTEVSSAVENLLFSADETVSTTRALQRLNAARRQLMLQRGSGGKLYELTQARDALRARLERAEAASAGMIYHRATVEKYRGVTAQTRRKLTLADDRCHAYETLQILKYFDILHAGERKVAALRADEEKMRREAGHDGWLPDRQYVATLDSLARRLSAADGEVSLSAGNLAAMQRAQVGDASLASHAGDIDELGGAEEVAHTYAAHISRAVRRKIIGIILIILGSLLAAGALTVYFARLLPMTVALSSTLSVAGMLAAVAGIALLPSSGRARRAASELLYRIGMDAERTDYDGIVNYAAACAGAKEEIDSFSALLGGIEAQLADRRAEAAAVRADCREALSRVGADAEDDGIGALLASVAEDAAARCSEHEELCRDIDKYKSSVADTAARLAGYDEASLRAHLHPDAASLLEGANATTLKTERDGLSAALEAGMTRLREAEKNLAITENTCENPARVALLLADAERELDACQRQYDAIALAYDSINGAGESLRRSVTPRLRSLAGQVMAGITGGKYGEFGVGEDFSVSLLTPGGTRGVAALSAGTRDAAYFALRTALQKLLYPDELPPMLLDEIFAQLDDGRAENLLRVILELCRGSDGAQCLIFSCHSREKRILDSLGMPCNLITL